MKKVSSFRRNLGLGLHVYTKYKRYRNVVLINTLHLCQHYHKTHYRKYKIRRKEQ